MASPLRSLLFLLAVLAVAWAATPKQGLPHLKRLLLNKLCWG
ncbi:cystatin C, isoform CRA_c [Mus musculus]|nr:cystatin C, isoform CRA_c [Mus musculus]